MPLPPSAILLSNTNPNKNNIADFPTPILPNLAIAPEFSHLLPDPNLTIAELLEFHLPSQSVSLFVPRVDGVFSAIDAIRKGFEQAQIITFWVEAAIALRARRLWKDAETWLNRQEKNHTEAVDEARGLFWALSWTASLHVLEIPSTIDTLATLLSDKLIDDEIINLMVNHLANRVRRRPELLSTVVLAPTQLSSWIQEAYGRKKVTAPCRSLKRFQEFFTKKLRKVLFCIANISNIHWILIRVDFDARTIAKS